MLGPKYSITCLLGWLVESVGLSGFSQSLKSPKRTE